MLRRWLVYGVASVLSLCLLVATLEMVRRLVNAIFYISQDKWHVIKLVRP